MLDQELQKLWQETPPDMQVKFNHFKLMIDLNHDIRKFKRTLFWRNVREIIAAVIVMIFFGRPLLYSSDNFAQVGAGIIILGAFLVIIRLMTVKRFKNKSSSYKSFKSYLKQSRQYLLREKRLLETVLYWYILPSLLGYTVFGLGLPYTENHWILWVFYGFYLIFGISISVFVLWMNRQALIREFNPILERIEKTLESLESS